MSPLKGDERLHEIALIEFFRDKELEGYDFEIFKKILKIKYFPADKTIGERIVQNAKSRLSWLRNKAKAEEKQDGSNTEESETTHIEIN